VEKKVERTRIKMCGTTCIADAQAAVHAGVDALGFIFVKKSPRYVSFQHAANIISGLPPFVSRVGVFVNSPLEEMCRIVDMCGLTQLQLHGDESPQLCLDLKTWNKSCSICKAFRIGDGSPPIHINKYSNVIDSILLDTYAKDIEGGTGMCFNWELIDSIQCDKPIILAGGLNPENITDALEKVAPYAIDINSGIEKAPGVKDHDLLYELVRRVRAVDAGLAFSH